MRVADALVGDEVESKKPMTSRGRFVQWDAYSLERTAPTEQVVCRNRVIEPGGAYAGGALKDDGSVALTPQLAHSHQPGRSVRRQS